MRSLRTGHVRYWTMRDAAEDGHAAPTVTLHDPAAMHEAARLGRGVALLAMPDVLRDVKNGKLMSLTPQWCADEGAISLCYASRTLLPAKTRVFVDLVTETFRRDKLAERFASNLGE